MGVIVTKDDDKNAELTRRINADLRAKMSESSKDSGDKKDPDFVNDMYYVKDLKRTGKFGWVWAVLIILALAVLIGLGVSFNK